jgi:hypothetical protein
MNSHLENNGLKNGEAESVAQYFDLLELTPGATAEDVRRQYFHLKNLYSADSIEMTALNKDFSQEMRDEYLNRLEEAYDKAKGYLEQKRHLSHQRSVVMDDELSSWIRGTECFTGDVLRQIRERLGIGLKEIYSVTRVPIRVLEAIENESFDTFQAEVYLRSYLMEYCRHLSLDSQRVLADYLPRFRSANNSLKV